MKKLFSTLRKFVSAVALASAIVAPTLVAPQAVAQNPTSYPLINGGTNKVTALASNAPIYLNVSEFSEITLQASVTGTGTSNLLFRIYRSVDSTDYETNPFADFIAPSSSTTNTAVTNITLGATGVIKIVPANTNSGGFLTNVVLKARFKASKVKISGS